MFTVNNTIDNFLRECYFNNKYIRYIDSTYAHNIPKGGDFWLSATYYNKEREVLTFASENDLKDFLEKIDFNDLEKIKISTRYYDIMIIDKLAI